MRYGLIGNNVNNSFSKYIHHLFNNDDYFLLSVNKKKLQNILLSKKFRGLNITKPYKKEVIQYLDKLDNIASKTNSVNTIINKDGLLIGYNTDYDGLRYLFEKNGIDITGKNIAILGSGGVSSTVECIAKELNAKNIYRISRKPKQDYITYKELEGKNVEIIINATPRGMSENSFRPLVNLKRIIGLEAVIDLIYNPLNTFLLQEAKKLNVKAINGLDMLIEQARLAEELFQNTNISKDKNVIIYQKILDKNLNIAFIGMPYSGKSTIAYNLSQLLNKDFIDLDMLIEASTNLEIKDFINRHGEKEFRKEEYKMLKLLSFQNGEIISCGGGVVLNNLNMSFLMQNSIVVYLKRDIKLIEFDDSRPLASNEKSYLELLKKREKLYEKYADITVENNKTVEEVVLEIARKYYEIFSN
ncbi:MAG: hypothetical protein J1F31_05470 [Erysipelotrichales bacterium]|nr:hypothetical protein [Erysipelotrichales bacterium]